MNVKKAPLLKANNPTQYDSSEMNWKLFGDESSRSRIYFKNALESFVEKDDIENKVVVDIGCGTGYVSNWLKVKGASEVVGFDPASQNVAISREKYQSITFAVATLHEFGAVQKERFDTAVSVMVFEHIFDLNEAFADVAKLLKMGGKFYLIIGDKEGHLSPNREDRPDLLEFEILNDFGDGTVEAKTVRDLGSGNTSVMYDFFRPLEAVKEAATRNGLRIRKETPLLVNRGDKKVPICHALLFTKGE